MHLTKSNYFSRENKKITSSKLRDFMRSKEYYYRKHIEGSIEPSMSPALLLGSMVDTYVTESPAKFKRLYVPVERRNLKNPPEGYTEVPQALYDQALAMGKKVRATKVFKEIRHFKNQVLLQTKTSAGLLDFLHVEDDKSFAHIVDLKTAKTSDPKKYMYHALDYGYDIQMALYLLLVSNVYGIKPKNIRCSHIVIEKDNDGIYPINVFEFSQETLMFAANRIYEASKQIAKCTKKSDFKDPQPSWDEVNVI